MKCGLILAAGDTMIDAGDFHGLTEVFLDQEKFEARVAELFSQFLQDEEVMGKPLTELYEHEAWDQFVETTWIDDRFTEE